MVVSAGKPWEPVLVVVRWITLPGTVLVRQVTPGLVTTAARRDTTVGTALRCRVVRVRGVQRQASRSRVGARPHHRVCTSCPKIRMRLSLTRRSLVIF
ncbi:hypothetical protein F2Q70_00029801 [Brassica cretica]|uniref:Uncharacterized protein n=1 Tax=Brassica cretica TaxID=69181 RepID=A0A8S9FI02_BRACR|nr:hypothetical protein F2Q70_00029801 [Brassica cretica]KAF3590622.1 hypothetical protein DY000_02020930 [Brassica cretica]